MAFYLSFPFIYLLSLLPFRVLYWLSDAVFYLIFYVFKYRRNVVWNNLKNSFPEKSEADLRQIERDFYETLSDYFVESIKSFSISKNTLLGKGRVLNPEILQPYVEKKQNIIVTGGHCGSQELINLFMSASPDFPLTVKPVYHPLANAQWEHFFKKSRSRFGSVLYPMKQAHQAIEQQEHLRPFGFVLINDQSARPDRAYWTTFLNQHTSFYKGTELFAKQYDMPVVFMHISRPSRGQFNLRFIELSNHPQQEPENAILEKHSQLLEQNIRENPRVWLWSHKRWKHKKA